MDLDNISLGGGFLVKLMDISVDPVIQGRMRQAPPGARPLSPLYEIGKSYAVSLFLRSEHPQVKAGDHFEGIHGGPYVPSSHELRYLQGIQSH